MDPAWLMGPEKVNVRKNGLFESRFNRNIKALSVDI
jgi:hypothetical protein